jgi:hypothetical protein
VVLRTVKWNRKEFLDKYLSCPVESRWEVEIAGKSRPGPLVEGRRCSVEKSHLKIEFAGHMQVYELARARSRQILLARRRS